MTEAHGTKSASRNAEPVTAVILAAGAGKRLGALSQSTSKAMVPLLGRPLIQWVCDRLATAGVNEIVVVVHESDGQLRDYLGNQAPQIRLVTQHERRGIADAIVQALPAVKRDAYLACACDSLFAAEDIRRVIAAGERGAAVAVQNMGVDATATRSAVEVCDGAVVRLLEKPPPGTTVSPLVALPLYWLPMALAPLLNDAAPIGGERHVTTALNQFIAAGGRVAAVPVTHRIEITKPEDIARAETELNR